MMSREIECDDPLQVLLMDRDPAVRGHLRFRVEDEGFRAFEADTGRRAIDIASQERLHVLVLDIEMPDISGIDAYRVIKVASRFVPCIFTGSHINQRTRMSALAAEAFSLLPKPVSDDVFADVFHRLLRRFYGRL